MRLAGYLLLCSAALACDRAPSPSAPPPQRAKLDPAAGGNWVVFEGACDASGAVPLDGRRFAVADDEDSVLRIYDARKGGPPEARLDVADAIGLEKKGKKGKRGKKKGKNEHKKHKSLESDIEAAAHIGDAAFFLTSHARTKSGKRDPNRFRFFATEVPHEGSTPHLIGEASTDLLDQMLREESLAGLGLSNAALLPAKTEGALNLEGMTATPEGSLWIGFRSPQPRQKALVVSLENPRAVLDGDPASFGAPELLDLGGLGIRALSSCHGMYLIVAGPTAGERPSELFVWDGSTAPTRVSSLDLEGWNPEGFFTPEGGDAMLLLSDDGEREIQGKACKRLKDPTLKRFRGLRVDLRELRPWLSATAASAAALVPSVTAPGASATDPETSVTVSPAPPTVVTTSASVHQTPTAVPRPAPTE